MVSEWWTVAVCLWLASILFKQVTQKYHHISLAQKWNCLAPTKEINLDPVFGIDQVHKLYKAFQARQYIQYYAGRFYALGSTFSTHVLLTHKIYTVEPLNIHSILSTDSQSYSIGRARSLSFRPLLGKGLFGAMGKDWEYARPLLMRALPSQRAFTTDFFAQHADHLVDCLPSYGEIVDLQDLFLRMTMDSATDLLLGQSIGLLKHGTNPSAEQFSINSHQAQRGALRHIRLGLLTWLYPTQKRRTNRATQMCRSYISDLIAAMGNDPAALPECVLRRLLELGMEENELVDHVLTLLFAARDTTASLLSMEFYLLARQPRIWRRLREEVNVFNGERPSVPQVQQLKYVGWVVNETLRLYPSAPHLTRVATRDTSLPTGGGPDGKSAIFVAKDQSVSWDLNTLHRNPSVFGPDPEEFRPERWADLNPGWAYAPFGGGPRMCIGKKFALVEAAYATVRLVQYADRLEPRDDRGWEELLSFTCINRNGTKVAFFD